MAWQPCCRNAALVRFSPNCGLGARESSLITGAIVLEQSKSVKLPEASAQPSTNGNLRRQGRWYCSPRRYCGTERYFGTVYQRSDSVQILDNSSCVGWEPQGSSASCWRWHLPAGASTLLESGHSCGVHPACYRQASEAAEAGVSRAETASGLQVCMRVFRPDGAPGFLEVFIRVSAQISPEATMRENVHDDRKVCCGFAATVQSSEFANDFEKPPRTNQGCSCSVAALAGGGLIQTAVGRAGGRGCARTKRSGFRWKAWLGTTWRWPMRSSARWW